MKRKYPQPPLEPLVLVNLNCFIASIALCLRRRSVLVFGSLSGEYLILDGITFPDPSTHTFRRITPCSCTPPSGCFILATLNPLIFPFIPLPTPSPSDGPLPLSPVPPLPSGEPSGVPSGFPLYPPLPSPPVPVPVLSVPLFLLPGN